MNEFLRVFGPPAHVEAAGREDRFSGWCDDWPTHALYDAAAAARVLARFDDGCGYTPDGERLVCTALEACGALVQLQ